MYQVSAVGGLDSSPEEREAAHFAVSFPIINSEPVVIGNNHVLSEGQTGDRTKMKKVKIKVYLHIQ